MGYLKKLKKANLMSSLEGVLDKFVSDGDSKKKLLESIDASGLRSSPTMNAVGLLQRSGKLQPGLYKELVALNAKLGGGDSGPAAESEQPAESSAAPQASHQEAEKVMSKEEKKAETATEEKSNVVNLEGFALTEKDQEKIKAKLAKEEEKVRQRLMKYEQKQVERLKARAEKRAQRQGMKLEQMQDIKDRKEKLTVLREQIKELKAQAKKLKDEIKELRPKRAKKDGEGKAEGETKAEKKADKKSA